MSVRKTEFIHIHQEADHSALERAAEAIRNGLLVAFPTETVYGLGANAFDERAVRNIFRVKERPFDNPLIAHVGSVDAAMQLMQNVPEHFTELTHRFWPGPLTLVVSRNAAVPDVVTAELDTIAVRMPDHHVALELLKLAGLPVAAPSANIAGRPSPTTAADAYAELQGKVAMVLDGGPCSIGIESTVLDLTQDEPLILRPGSITREQLQEFVGTGIPVMDEDSDRPQSPGMKYRHYSPKTPLVLVLSDEKAGTGKLERILSSLHDEGHRLGLIGPASYESLDSESFFSLGPGRPIDYARLMYKALIELDRARIDRIICPGIAEHGLGVAVMNRLKKAATRIE